MLRDIEAPLMASAALAAGPFLFLKGFRTVRTRRLMANTPTARIRSMAMGLVEVSGTVVARSTQTAPFSGKPCAYWEVEIASVNRRQWTTLHRNHSGHPFFLRDETGVALVYPHGAESRLPVTGEERCQGLMLPAFYSDYMNAHASVLGQISRVGVLRFRERVLEEGTPIYALGTASPRSQARLIGEGDQVDHTGANAAQERLRTLDHEATAVIRRGDNEATFILSQESERSLMLTLGGRALLEVAGGPALTMYGLGYWLLVMSMGPRP